MVGITYEDVEGIVSAALEDGFSAHQITTQYVSEVLGSGWLGAISLHLKRYWTENAIIGVSASVMASDRLYDLHCVISDIVSQQTVEVRAVADARAEHDAVRVAAAYDELAFALKTNADLETTIGVRDREIEGLHQIDADAQVAIDRGQVEWNTERAVTYRENRRLMAELSAARAETSHAQNKCTQALSKLKVFQRERAEFAGRVADITAGHNESSAKIERLQGALDELRRERDAGLSASTLTSAAAPTSVTQIPSLEMPHASAQAESMDEVNG